MASSWRRQVLFPLALVLGAPLLARAVQPPVAGDGGLKKVVLIAGKKSHGPVGNGIHDYPWSVKLLKVFLDNSNVRDRVRVEYHLDGWPQDQATLEDAHAIMVISDGRDGEKYEEAPHLQSEERVKFVARQIARGCGFLTFHFSTFAPDRYAEQVLDWSGGYFDWETDGRREWYSAILTQEAEVHMASPDHPISRGLKPFRLREEFYYNIRFRPDDPGLRPIWVTPSLPGREPDGRIVAWARERGDGGRGFGTTVGHFYDNWKHESFRKMVLNAIVWCAGLDVPEGGVETRFYTREEITAALMGIDGTGPGPVEGRFGQALDAARGGTIAPANPRYGELPITIELWARLPPEGRGSERVLLSNGMRGSGNQWELAVDRRDGRLTVHLGGFEPASVRSRESLDDGAWHHVAVALERSRVRVFVDGKLSGSWDLTWLERPAQPAGLGIGTRLEDKRPSSVLLDDVRISSGLRDAIAAPEAPLIEDRRTMSLWSFDEPLEKYLARWTPGGETNQRDLPYPHRIAEYEFENDRDWVDGRWQRTDHGPFLTHSVTVPGYEVGPKSMVLFLEESGGSAVLFDLARCATVAGLARSRLRIDPARFGLLRKPALDGDVQFYLPPVKAWRRAPGSAPGDPAPLGKDEVDYRGLYLSGDRVLLSYKVMGSSALDTSAVEERGPARAIARFLEIDPPSTDAFLTICEMPSPPRTRDEGGVALAFCEEGRLTRAVALVESSRAGALTVRGNDVLLSIPAGGSWKGKWLLWTGASERWDSFLELARASPPSPPLSSLKEPAAGRWGPPLVTEGRLAQDDGKAAYLIDTVTVPYENPHRALFFISGFDFLPGGDAALCTAHGDVWLVRGLDPSLRRVTWQRFATGLYQPLGLKVVKGKVIVLGRDQLTRLHDRNGDGEADFYESFNHDLIITGGDHAFTMRLEADAEGNLYFIKSGSRGPYGGALLRVSADGKELSVVARGFRHPYGLGIGPGGEITVADNEGNWVPSSKIDLIRKGGFYGFLDDAERAPEGLAPERPLCYIPKVEDNSSGGQSWVTSERWGDYHRGEMLHLSWGRSTLHAVLREKVDGVWQAATVRFPGLRFLSGTGEGEFHPLDGQFYVVGLDGWQTGAVADGCFQRMRYTGRPVYMPVSFHLHQSGVRISFSQPLERSTAVKPENYRLEQWNYRWSSTYGSFHYSVKEPERIGHDVLDARSVELLADGRAVYLEVLELREVDQLHVHTDIRAADGTPLRFDIYSTVNALAPPFRPAESGTR